jgi:alpha-tubulin suppressor-like RCC1 family protein
LEQGGELGSTGLRAAAVLILALLLPACGIGGGGTLTPTTAPGIPALVTAVGGNSRVTLSWAPPGTPVTITVSRSQTSGGPYFPVSTPAQFPSSSSYVDPALHNGTTYYYVVTASNQFGTSPPSAEVEGTPRFAVASVAQGSMTNHTLVLFEDGTVWGWGSNIRGEIGNGIAQSHQSTPVQAQGLPRVTALTRGVNFSLALDTTGAVWAWGDDTNGQLGRYGLVGSLVPLQVSGIPTMTAVSAGYSHVLALAGDGSVWAWGTNSFGELGFNSSGLTVATPSKVANVSGIVAIAAGGNFSLALAADGTVWGWGINQSGELGTGATSTPVYSPVQVRNLNGIVQIAAGGDHGMALRDDGTVWCWGSNLQGQNGSGAVTVNVPSATQASNLAGVVSIAAGSSHSIAAKGNGTVWAWGSEYNSGALGNGSQTGTSTVPVQVLNLTGAIAVSGGYYHGIAVRDDGTIWTWGDNSYGQLGTGAGDEESTPTQVDNLTQATAVDGGGSHSVALRSDGSVWAWGSNYKGELGNGTVSAALSLPGQVKSPLAAGFLTNITAVACGSGHSLARQSDGTLWTWGQNDYGQIGNGATSSTGVSTPFHIAPAGANFVAMAGGALHSLAVRNDATNAGTVWAWGYNGNGQLGNGAVSASSTTSPAQVVGQTVGTFLTGITAVAAGNAHSLALQGNGQVWAWGVDTSGQVGLAGALGTNVVRPAPVLANMAAVAAGEFHSLALGQDGTVWAWGSNDYGEIGSGTPASGAKVATPVQVPGLAGMVAISAGTNFSVALKNDGTLWSWGLNLSCQLGDGTTISHTAPAPVIALTSVTAFGSGASHSLAVRSGGLVWAWGFNLSNELGTPFIAYSTVPVVVTR